MKGWELTESFKFRDRTVRWAAWGQGRPVVLIHGTPFSSYIWHRIVPCLRDRFCLYVFDLLGYGQSEKGGGFDVSLGVQNHLLEGLLEHWGLELPDVVAHDFGGTTALRAHLLNGCAFRSLTLIDPVVTGPWGLEFDEHVRNYAQVHESALRNLPAWAHAALVREFIRGSGYRPIPDAILDPYVEPWMGEVGQSAFYQQIAQYDMRYTDEIEGRLGELRCPTQLLWGEADAWLPMDKFANKLRQLIPLVRFRSVPESGHLVQEDAPEAIVAAVLDFPLAGGEEQRDR